MRCMLRIRRLHMPRQRPAGPQPGSSTWVSRVAFWKSGMRIRHSVSVSTCDTAWGMCRRWLSHASSSGSRVSCGCTPLTRLI